jgi:hypothetical protein
MSGFFPFRGRLVFKTLPVLNNYSGEGCKGKTHGKISRRGHNKKAAIILIDLIGQLKNSGSVASAEQVPSFSPTSPTKPTTYQFSYILKFQLLSSRQMGVLKPILLDPLADFLYMDWGTILT